MLLLVGWEEDVDGADRVFMKDEREFKRVDLRN